MPRIDYENLLRNISIDDVAVRLGMTLKKTSAKQYKSLCPFHDDKTPSLLIDADRDNGRQHYYCFSCGARGDAIDLVKQKFNLSFRDAVEWLAPSPTSSGRGHSKITERKSNAPSINLSALQFGYNLYQKGSNQAALDAWIIERSLDPITIKRAGFVYASRNFLSRSLETENDRSVRREYAGDLEDAFLIRKIIPGVSAEMHLPLSTGSESENRYSDFFIADRIIFPLHDDQGQLLGLAGRVAGTTSASVPKYQFTREFPKATILYRANFAFNLIKSEAKSGNKNIYLYLCEGFLDTLRFEALGIPSVAVMGSSISEQQVKLLLSLRDTLPKDTTLTVVVSFDRDEAGLRGASDACLKFLNAPIECAFLWPTALQVNSNGLESTPAKDPNDYLEHYSSDSAQQFLLNATYPPEVAVLAYAFGVTAEDILNKDEWELAPRTRRFRAFSQAFMQIEKAVGSKAKDLIKTSFIKIEPSKNIAATHEWLDFITDATSDRYKSYSESFLTDSGARLNHSRILAYMGSRRGELPCDEPRWERLDIAATVFNTLLTDRLRNNLTDGAIGSYNAVWVPRSFGGSDFRLKIMPLPEDLIVQQYLLNEILTERWDHEGFTDLPFSRRIPGVRYYREDRRTVTTGFDRRGNGNGEELSSQTLSFAYQIDMDVLEGRQPASDQGMYRPYAECWREFMTSLTQQATEIGYVYSIRLDVKRYYDQLRRYVVRDRLLPQLQSAIASVTDDTAEFATLLNFGEQRPSAATKASLVLDRLDEHLFGVNYARPDTGFDDTTNKFMGIPQGPVLSAWIGSIALFPVDEEAYRFMTRLNADHRRVGYARYVDDIVLLADTPETLAEMREAIDLCARKLELTLLAKADEIPAMSAEDFTSYINEGRALAAYGPAWEPPLVGDGESGWDFWSVAPATDRQSALQLLHNVELYKASKSTLLNTVRTAFQAPDLRASELPKAARLIWYSIAVEHLGYHDSSEMLSQYMESWDECIQGAAWALRPELYGWESPILFALEGLEHLIDKQSRDIAELSAEENVLRRHRIAWLAELVLSEEFDSYVANSTLAPQHQLNVRLALVRWKAMRLVGKATASADQLDVERSRLVQTWRPFEWMHKAVSLLTEADQSGVDPLTPLVAPAEVQKRKGIMSGLAADVFMALLPNSDDEFEPLNEEQQASALSIALQTIVAIVPKENLPVCLSRRNHLIWNKLTPSSPSRIIIPPLPGIKTTRLFSCIGESADNSGSAVIHEIEALDFSAVDKPPVFLGSESGRQIKALSTTWSSEIIADSLVRIKGELATEDYFLLRERASAANIDISADTLKLAAKLYRAVVQIITTYTETNDNKELVPAWPYIAADCNNEFYYLITNGVSREELGNRAFIRDGGRALRTTEVPIFEANLWRAGVAISDYLGLYDDHTKFSSADSDITLDAAALTNPARYVLRTQLRKLRGVYADSQISKRRSDDGLLPATVVRALRLLETFPDQADNSLNSIFYVLAAEAESAAMYLAFRESWEKTDSASFLASVADKVLNRLPLSIGQVLSTRDDGARGVRRDLVGPLCFARRLFSVSKESPINELPAWKAMRSGVVSAGIYVAFEGLIASLRSHGSFERYENFDFPEDWGIPLAPNNGLKYTQAPKNRSHSLNRTPLIEQCRRLVQHLGHRLLHDNLECLPRDLYEKIATVSKTLASIDYRDEEAPFLEWPFEILSDHCLALLNLELLESVVLLVKQIDEELGFEPILVIEKSYGYNAQTKRFTDSRNGVRDVTPWMISQFPKLSKHIEEISHEGQFLRVWTEVFDRTSGKLLSVSALGEPFASIAIIKPTLHSTIEEAEIEDRTQLSDIHETDSGKHYFDFSAGGTSEPTPGQLSDTNVEDLPGSIALETPPKSDNNVEKTTQASSLHTGSSTNRNANSFRKQQAGQWELRGASSKPNGLIRIAFLQADFDLTYQHPFVEACPTQWPFGAKVSKEISAHLKSNLSSKYSSLLRAAERHDTAHLWTKSEFLPSWSEHRRRSILRRVIDSCQNFNVDLLILPEYSVRRETLEWLKTYIVNKSVSVLAGTYMHICEQHSDKHLTAPLTLLWPLPQSVSKILLASLQKKNLGSTSDYDSLQRGQVLEFSRNKKYRSIALEEFFRPSSHTLKPLFNPSELAAKLGEQIGFEPTPEALITLLAETRLPLKYLLELICSEAFLVSSPANYVHMGEDLKAMWRRFGRAATTDEVLLDIGALSKKLSITGDGIEARRSILAVPAATSRSADYWFAGQAGFLAAGTTTVFCNSIDGKTLVGGSCFIGRGSWKAEDTTLGYLARITPYHGWSKGIYYNNKDDALSRDDQALVISDIDPHNMLEGKPRAQTMPSPLQLVAYLPLVESIDWQQTQSNLLKALSISLPDDISSSYESNKKRPQEESIFWSSVWKLKNTADADDFNELWSKFSDKKSLLSRAQAYQNNVDMQPTAPRGSLGIFSSPALYDWIDVNLTLTEHEELPNISVPPWRFPDK
ncbi:DNA primase [Pseudomonas fluorescens]|uniref:CHC2 zinc finger domain-containing protein n=1 Tax=Pseudomonas fluorescens TaxID=294 RepID=UPI0012405C3F|nr:CHC2 zinc finger domain-containing protein [Pseudomonas fluorescens]VVN04053.1 DNA primase [Pseudomonas fluorescens]